MNQFIRSALVTLGLIFLAGCATQQNVPLGDNFWKNPKQKIAVVTTKAPKPQIYQMGNQGLLDYAINSAMNKNLDNYLSSTDLSWYRNIPSKFTAQLKQRNVYAKAYLEPLGDDQTNYASFARQIDSDKLLVIKLEALGAKRDYYAFIPVNAPQAYCVMTGELISTKNNLVLWRYKTTITEQVQGAWDQPPNYPNLGNALSLAISSAQQELLDSFFSGH
jgi:hypothetical protein